MLAITTPSFGLILVLLTAGLYPSAAAAQCPDRIPPNVLNAVRNPEVRAQAAGMPPLTAGFIAQNGGINTMVQQVRAQIDHDRKWVAEEEANQRTLAAQAMGNIERARTGRDLLQRQKDSVLLSEAYLKLLECHAGRMGVNGGRSTQGSFNQGSIAENTRRWQGEAAEGAIDDRRQMVNGAMGSWQPPRGYAGSAASAGDGLNLEDPLPTKPVEECRPSIVFQNTKLAADGASIEYTLSAVQPSGAACTVSFGIAVRAGDQMVTLPARTLVVPADGLTLSESVRLPNPVDSSAGSCTQAEPLRVAYVERRDQLAMKYDNIRKMAADTIASRSALERSVTMRDVGNAVLTVGIALDTLKLGLSTVSPAAGSALDFGGCVGVELATYIGKTVTACSGKDPNECTSTVLTDGAVWVEKNLACAFQSTFSAVDKAVDTVQIAKQALDLHDSLAARSKTLDVLQQLDDSFGLALKKLEQIRASRDYIDETLRQLERQCRSPLVNLTAVDVRVLAASGK
jgi:hypothetical protein